MIRSLIIILLLHFATQFSVSQPDTRSRSASIRRAPASIAVPHGPAALAPLYDAGARHWADSVLATLTTRQRIAQMMSVFSFSNVDGKSLESLKRLVFDERVGGVIISKGTVSEAKNLIDSIQKWAEVPVLISADFEYGLTMRLEGATEFPSAMALGATRSPNLGYAMGHAVAQEARIVGVHQNYAPVSDVNNNPANPVINIRAFGEQAALVARMAGAYARGMQEAGVIATAKHFPGHGDTEADSHSNLPSILKLRAELDSLELAPFRALIREGIMSVMTAHLAVPALGGDSALPATFSRRIIDTLLKRELGFTGLVVSDALNMGAIINTYGSIDAVRLAIEAGVDVLLIPSDISASLDSLTLWTESGALSKAAIDASARKLLQFKYWSAHSRPVQREGMNSPAHKTLALSIARRAVTLVKNEAMLPLKNDPAMKTEAVMLLHAKGVSEAQQFMDEVQQRVTVRRTYMAERALSANAMNEIIDSLRSADRIIVASFAGVRSQGEPAGISGEQRQLLAAIEMLKIPVVFLAMQSPYVLAAMPSAKAMLCTYDKGAPSMRAAADALVGDILPTGKLPVTIPGVAPYGTGLSYTTIVATASAEVLRPPSDAQAAPYDPDGVRSDEARATRGAPSTIDASEVQANAQVTAALPTQWPLTSTEARSPSIQIDDSIHAAFEDVDRKVIAKIQEQAFPGAQLAVGKRSGLVYYKNYGTLTYDSDAPNVTNNTLYDIASLTKVVATTLALMQLYEQGKLKLDDPVVQYIPEFGANGKRDVKIRHLLTHTGGLPAFKQYWKEFTTADEVLEDIYDLPLAQPPGTKMVYSDLGFITLAKVVESIVHTPLNRWVEQMFYVPMAMRNSMFTPPLRLQYLCAPTELDNYWRKALVQGTVHDENAALLDGVAGHAGLFSTARDLSRFVRMLMNGGELDGVRYLKQSTIEQFTQQQPGASGRALGWDTRSESGSSSGALFSPGSYGHTGFTGTSIWIDPKDDVFVIFLTNRVHPTRENKALPRFRAPLHDAVRRALER